jgi:hypothetical protein
MTIAPGGVKLCGRIAWLTLPLSPQGKPKPDLHGHNAAVRYSPLCGLENSVRSTGRQDLESSVLRRQPNGTSQLCRSAAFHFVRNVDLAYGRSVHFRVCVG